MLKKCSIIIVNVIKVERSEEERICLLRLFLSRSVGKSSGVVGGVSSPEKQD